MFKTATSKTETIAIALLTTASVVSLSATGSAAAAFQYTTLTNQAIYKEGATTVAGSDYDGTFTNTVFNPFSGRAQTFSGFYRVESGVLGQSVSIQAVQQTPTDRTALGTSGIIQTEYLALPQPVSTVAAALIVPPDLTDFDFKFVPAPVLGRPTILSRGWTAEPVSEPSTAVTLVGLGLMGVGLGKKRAEDADDFEA